MSNVSYDLGSKGVRLIDAKDAWVKGKNGKMRLNPDYHFVGKMQMSMPNMIVTASDKKKPTFKGSTSSLNQIAKRQIVAHFYDEKGNRNKKKTAYFGVLKNTNMKKCG